MKKTKSKKQKRMQPHEAFARQVLLETIEEYWRAHEKMSNVLSKIRMTAMSISDRDGDKKVARM